MSRQNDPHEEGRTRWSTICECAENDCMGRIEITAWRYEDIHEHARRYVILPGHTRIAGEEIVEENSYYEIVKKAV